MAKIIQLIKRYKFELLIIACVLFIYHGWFSPGIIQGADFQYRPEELFRDYINFGSWDPSLNGGYYTTFAGQLNKAPVFILSGILSFFVNYPILQRIIWLFPFLLLGFFGMRTLARYMFRDNKELTFYSTLFFLINPTVVERFYRGHVWFTLVYAITPYAIYFMVRAIHGQKRKYILLASTALSVSLFLEVRTALLQIALVSALFIFIVVKERFKHLKVKVASFATIGIFTFLFNLFWILPLFLQPSGAAFDEGLLTASSIRGVGGYTGDLFQVFQFYPKSWEQFYLPTTLLLSIFLIIPLIANSFRRYKFLGFFYALLLVFLFLGKGSTDPLGEIFVWLAQNVPYFVGYRVSNKFLLIIAPVYALIAGLGFSYLYRYLRARFHPLQSLLVPMVIVVLLLSNNFLINGYLTDFNYSDSADLAINLKNEPNMFNPLQLSADYSSAWEKIQNYTEEYRSLWFPKVSRYRFTDYKHPLVLADKSLFSEQDKVFDGLLSDRNSRLYKDDSYKNLAFLMRLWRIKSLVVRPDTDIDWNYSSVRYEQVLEALLNQSYLTRNDDLEIYARDIYSQIAQVTSENGTVERRDTYTEYKASSDKEITSFTLTAENRISIYDNIYLQLATEIDTAETVTVMICNSSNICQEESLTYTSSGSRIKLLKLRSDLENISSISFKNILAGNRVRINGISLIKGSMAFFTTEMAINNKVDVVASPAFIAPEVILECRDLEPIKDFTDLIPYSYYEKYASFFPDSLALENCVDLTNFKNLEALTDIGEQSLQNWKSDGNSEISKEIAGRFTFLYKSQTMNSTLIYIFAEPVTTEDNKLYFYIAAEKNENVFIDAISSNGAIYTQSMDLHGDFKSQIVELDLATTQLTDIKELKIRNIISDNQLRLSNFQKKIKIKSDKIVSAVKMPVATFTQLSPTTYIIKIREAKSPFFVTLQESFNKYWSLSIETSSNVIKVDKSDHLLINGYANAWFINRSGDYNIMLEFGPENYFRTGGIISIAAFISLAVIAAFERDGKKHPHKTK